MKFSALREDLLNAVQTVQYSASAKGMMPILSGVKMESDGSGMAFHATDLESYTVTSCAAKVEREGSCVVNLKVFMDFLRDLKDERIDAEVSGSELEIRGQKGVYKLYTMPVEDFPKLPEVQKPVLEEVDAGTFIAAVQKVSRAASRDEKRPTLMGILLEIGEDAMSMVSTDSYRLAIRRIREGYRVREGGQFIIPATAMANLSRVVGKAEKLSLYKDEGGGQVRFESGGANHVIRLIEGKFPKYGQFIPERLEKTLEVDKEEILGALKRASLISSTVRLSLGAGGVKVASESREIGEGKETVEALYDGDEMEIAFNSRFLEDGITCIEGEKAVMGVSEPLKPGIIKEKESEDFMYIIMPIRL